MELPRLGKQQDCTGQESERERERAELLLVLSLLTLFVVDGLAHIFSCVCTG